jgi:hypothetical protein
MIYILLGTILLVSIIFMIKNIKKIGFKIPFFEASIETHSISLSQGKGGKGGDVKVRGNNNTAIAGKGGGGGLFGKGGDGGSVEGEGDNIFAIGGEGGEAGQLGQAGKGGRGPLHVLMEDYPEKAKEIFETFGITEEMAKTIGKGGDGETPLSKEIQK